jgi:hypothetical protein
MQRRWVSPSGQPILRAGIAVQPAETVDQPLVGRTLGASRSTPGYARIVSGHEARGAISDRPCSILAISIVVPAAWIWGRDPAANDTAISVLDAGLRRRRRRAANCRCDQRDCDKGKVTHSRPPVVAACLLKMNGWLTARTQSCESGRSRQRTAIAKRAVSPVENSDWAPYLETGWMGSRRASKRKDRLSFPAESL